MQPDAKERLDKAAHAIYTAVLLLRMEMETLEAFLEECRKMDSVGPILDPTLFRDPERRSVSALLRPIFEGAVEFVAKYDHQMIAAQAALKQVGKQSASTRASGDRPAPSPHSDPS